MNDFYKKRKKPWIGFVLVLLLGPFGFLYNSWKTTLFVFLIGPLWIMFLRHTRFDLLENPWAHYIALLLLAGFAALQITGQNNSLATETTPDMAAAIMTAILSLLPDQKEQIRFRAFLHEHPPLLARVMTLNRAPVRPKGDIDTRWKIACVLVSYGSMLTKSGDFPTASSCLLYSMMFLKDNPLAWVSMAELYSAWKDRIAARWASKILQYHFVSGRSKILDEIVSDAAWLSDFEALKRKMRAIIQECEEHPDWRDSYPLRKAVFNDL
jgi:hypothetical protein